MTSSRHMTTVYMTVAAVNVSIYLNLHTVIFQGEGDQAVVAPEELLPAIKALVIVMPGLTRNLTLTNLTYSPINL